MTLLGGRQHALLAVVGSSVGFAYLHMPSYVAQLGWEEALLRSTVSAMFSAAAAIIALRSGSLMGPIVFHAVNDAQMMLGDPGSPASGDALNFRPVVVGLVIASSYWFACRKALRTV